MGFFFGTRWDIEHLYLIFLNSNLKEKMLKFLSQICMSPIRTGLNAAFPECLNYDCMPSVRYEGDIFRTHSERGSTSSVALLGYTSWKY